MSIKMGKYKKVRAQARITMRAMKDLFLRIEFLLFFAFNLIEPNDRDH